MKKILLLLFFLQSFSLTALDEKNTNTWYKPGDYQDSRHHFMFQSVEIKGAPNFYKFKSNLRKDQDVLDEFKNNNTTGVISYLFFEDNQIVIDESDIPPKIIDGISDSSITI